MTLWPKHPIIYEINTWVWLQELGQKYEKPVTLGTVPRDEWDALRDLGIDAVWFMGVWERSPAGIAIANRNADLPPPRGIPRPGPMAANTIKRAN